MGNRERQDTPFWYGKHDNPHHDGMTAHLRKIASAEDALSEATGVKGKHASLGLRKLTPRDILELTESIELPT